MGNCIDFRHEIETIKNQGELQGSDEMMGELLFEIHQLKEKLMLMSAIKAGVGITKIIEEYKIENSSIKLTLMEHFSELILTAEPTLNLDDNLDNKTKKTIDTVILGYLSNIRFETNGYFDEPSYYFKSKDKVINLNAKTFKDDLIKALINKDTISQYLAQELASNLPMNPHNKTNGKI